MADIQETHDLRFNALTFNLAPIEIVPKQIPRNTDDASFYTTFRNLWQVV